jgi:EAL domain-containing protein (putative c-di-GMP-specific phosphodiesterase class I)
MATKRPCRAGIFKSASRTPRKRSTPTGPQAALAALGGVAYLWDRSTDTLAWGPNACEVLSLAPDALPRTGEAFRQMVERAGGTDRDTALAEADGPERAYDARYALRFGAYKVLMVQDAGRAQPDRDGRPGLVRGLLRVDPEASAPDLLPATVKDRSALLRRIQDAIDEAVRFSHTCTLVVGACGTDNDLSFEAIARGLRPIMRRGDHVAMLGPNRFALILACCPAQEAASAMKRIAALMKDLCPGDALHLGAACSPDHTFDAAKLLRFAEEALAVSIKRPEKAALHKIRHSVPQARRHTPYDVVGALNDRRLTLTLRPVVDGPSRRPAMVQACAGLLGPGEKAIPLGDIPELAEANLSLLVDGRMLELAADHLAQNREGRLALPIRPATLQDREWLPMLAAHLGARPGIASRLVVQVPETILLDTEAAKGRLDTMKALGLSIGLTGFGTGHASYTALQSVPVDLVTIDGIFIQTLKRSTADRLFVRTLCDMAYRLGIATMAEWVDDSTSAEWLAAWGVDYMQGGLFGVAEAANEPLSILKRMKRA